MKKKSFLSRFLMIALAILAVIATITFVVVEQGFSASSGTLKGLGIDNLEVGYTVDQDYDSSPWTVSSRTIKGSLQSKAAEGMCGGDDTHYISTLSIEYVGKFDNSIYPKIVFNYDFIANGGILEFANQELSANSSSDDFEYEFTETNKLLQFKMTSNSTTTPTSLELTSIKCITGKTVNLTFKSLKDSDSHAVYYVNGQKIEEDKVITTLDTEIWQLETYAIEGFDFMGRSSNDTIFSTLLMCSARFDADSVIYPLFINKDSAKFSNNGNIFTDLNEANESALNSTDKTIYLLAPGGKLETGDYKISNGVTLYLPYSDSSVPLYDDQYIFSMRKDNAVKTPTAYTQLILQRNSKITIENGGILYVGATCLAPGGSYTISNIPIDNYGELVLEDESSALTLESGGQLYVYGYITGRGKITAEYGSTVHEVFQIADFRGGTATLGFLGTGCFPINQYFIQNCLTTLNLEFGSTLIVHSALYAMNKVNPLFLTFISSTLEGQENGQRGIFSIRKGGSIVRNYDSENDRMIYDVYGSCFMNSIDLDLGLTTVDSSDFILPITNNLTVNVTSGSDVIINQKLIFLPGSELNIEENSSVSISKNNSVIFYDLNSWKGNSFARTGDFLTSGYSPTFGVSGGKPDPNSEKIRNNRMKSARIDLNGTIQVEENAGFYSTIHTESFTANSISESVGSIFSSSSTGNVNFVGTMNKQDSIIQIKGDNVEKITINLTLPYYLNAKELEQTKPYTYFDNENDALYQKAVLFDSNQGIWVLGDVMGLSRNILFFEKSSDIEPLEEMTYTTGKPFTFPTSEHFNISFKNFSLKGWSVNNSFFSVGETVNSMPDLSNDAHAYAVWGGWIDDDGESYYLDYYSAQENRLKGLHRVPSRDGNEINIYYFDETTGAFKWDYTDVYNSTDYDNRYFIREGLVVESGGFEYYVSNIQTQEFDYVYIDKNNTLLTNKTCYVRAKEEDPLPSGRYTFDNNGLIVKEFPDMITNGAVQMKMNIENPGMFIDGIRVPYGLFLNTDGHYYYSNNDGQIIKDQTFYVEKTNDYNISEGLYYFDVEGRLCDQKTLEPVIGGATA